MDREEYMTVLKDIGMKGVNDTVVTDIFREMGLFSDAANAKCIETDNLSLLGGDENDFTKQQIEVKYKYPFQSAAEVELSMPRFNEAFRLYRARSGHRSLFNN